MGVLSNNEESLIPNNFITSEEILPTLDGAVLQCSEISYPKKNIPMFGWGSPGMTSYNAKKGQLILQDLVPNDLSIDQSKEGGINSREGNRGVSHPDF